MDGIKRRHGRLAVDVLCFVPAQRDFVPTLRVQDDQMHPDMYFQVGNASWGKIRTMIFGRSWR